MSNLSPFLSSPSGPVLAFSRIGLSYKENNARKVRWIALLMTCLVVFMSCESPLSENASTVSISMPETNSEALAAGDPHSTGDSLLASPLQLAYARALRMAEGGDPATLLLCDSLLAQQGPRGGAEPYYYKGIYYTTLKQPQKAIAWFDKTIETDYNFFEAYIEKSALLIEANQYEPAYKELELLRTLSPGYAPVHYWLGKWALLQNKKQMAIRHYRLALSLDSTLTEARLALEQLEK
jgi:tetratricopeptide (TPR) repeat protein